MRIDVEDPAIADLSRQVLQVHMVMDADRGVFLDRARVLAADEAAGVARLARERAEPGPDGRLSSDEVKGRIRLVPVSGHEGPAAELRRRAEAPPAPAPPRPTNPTPGAPNAPKS